MILPVRLLPQDYGKATLFDTLEFQLFVVFVGAFTLLSLVGGVHLSSWLTDIHYQNLHLLQWTDDPPPIPACILCEIVLVPINFGCFWILLKRLQWNLSIVLISLSLYSGLIFGCIFFQNQQILALDRAATLA